MRWSRPLLSVLTLWNVGELLFEGGVVDGQFCGVLRKQRQSLALVMQARCGSAGESGGLDRVWPSVDAADLAGSLVELVCLLPRVSFVREAFQLRSIKTNPATNHRVQQVV